MEKFKFYLRLLYSASFWCMDSDYNAEWDKKLSEAIDKEAIVWDDYYNAYIDSPVKSERVLVWVQNYPYYYATCKIGCYYNDSYIKTVEVRPSRYTIWRLKELEKKHRAKLEKKPKVHEH